MNAAPDNSDGSGDPQPTPQAVRFRTRARQWLYRLALPPSLGLVRMFWASYRWQAILGDEHIGRALADSDAVIPVMWHQHLMLGVPYLLRQRDHGLRLAILVSPSVDGEAGAMAVRRLGAHVVRGSATRTGARALRDLYLAISKEKLSLLITPDGSHGPRYEFKTGALLISQLTGKPMVPIAFAARRVFKFRAWDRFILPLPFTRVVLAIGEPVHAPRVLGPMEMQQLQNQMADILKGLYESARERLLDAS